MAFIEAVKANLLRVINLRWPKTLEKWLLYKYVGLEFTLLSRPFKTRRQAEKARLKYPEGERKKIGLGLIRTKS